MLINYNAGILMTNGMLWNIHKIARYGDTYMILDRHKLKFSGNLLIEKVNVSVTFIFIVVVIIIIALQLINLNQSLLKWNSVIAQSKFWNFLLK